MRAIVRALDIFHTEHIWEVDSMEKGREYAKRIVTEGLWLINSDNSEVFFPVHQVVKVKVIPVTE